MQEARIEDCYFQDTTGPSQCLIGVVFGHPKINDGTYVQTSSIVSRTDTTVTTKNTIYTLGTPKAAAASEHSKETQ